MRAAVCCAAILLATTPLAAQTAPTWRYAAAAPISFFSVTPLGTVVVATDDGLLSLDPDSGTVIWTREDISGLEPARYTAIKQSPFATVQHGRRFDLVDLVTGATRWRTPPSADLEPYLPIPERGLLLAYGSNDSLKHVLVAFDLETGAVRWERSQLFDLLEEAVPRQPALWVSDTTFLVSIPGHGPALMHAGTGEWLWGADKLKGWGSLPLIGIPAWARGGAMLIGDSAVYVSLEDRLHALRIHDGVPLWAKAPRFSTSIAQLELTAQGIVVRGRPGPGKKRLLPAKPWLRLIDPATGASRWSAQFGGLRAEPPPVTPFVITERQIYVGVKDKLMAVRLEDGGTTEVARVEFKGGEHPFLLERRGDGLLLIGNQNLTLLDTTGAERYHAYHPAPGRSTLAKVGLGTLGTLAVAATVAASALNAMAGALYAVEYTAAAPVAAAFGSPLAWDFEPTVSGGGADFWFPDLGKRYAASEQARNHVYSVAHERDSTGHKRPVFLRLHKDDGRVVGRVWLEEKRPEYALDLISGMLYVNDGSREIRAFRM